MDVAIEHMPPLRLGTVSHRGPYNQIGKAFEKLGQIAGPSGLFAQPGAAMIATYHDNPDATPAEELRSEAGIIVPEGVPLPPALEEVHIPEGDYAKYTHIGPFEGLGDAWQRLMGEWVPSSGRRLADSPSFEIYRSDMRTTPKEQLRTDIYVPLADGT
jgi:AraC family transcriptional regulator